jgi:hypothetical protein
MRYWRRIEVFLHRNAAWLLVALLILQSGLLGWIAFSNSPVVDEIAHLPAGLSHWKFQKFNLYRVNPQEYRCDSSVVFRLQGRLVSISVRSIGSRRIHCWSGFRLSKRLPLLSLC